MYEPQLRGAIMSDEQRGQFVQKAKLDRLAYESAELLSQGESDKAAAMISGITPASKEQFSTWFRLYATRHFKVAGDAVDKFLAG